MTAPTVFDFQVVRPFRYGQHSDTAVVEGNESIKVSRPDSGTYGTYRAEFTVHCPGAGIATGTEKTFAQFFAFCRALQGAYDVFLWKDPFVAVLYRVETSDTDGAIGTGDGSTDTFSLVHRDIDESTLKVYVNAVEQVSGWSITGNNPEADEAAPLIDFTSPPTNTHPITVEYDFYHRCVFKVDPDLGEWRGANVDFLCPVSIEEDWAGAHRA